MGSSLQKTTRGTEWARLCRQEPFDILIVGGGIHGASMAHLAAVNGLSVALVERSDYASETSSRSTKLAHGGLRYLELLDFKQVFEGIRCREELFTRAPHIVQPARFLLPVSANDWLQRVKLKAGLTLYDLMVRDPKHRHSWVPRSRLTHPIFSSDRTDLMGCFEYCDGQMDDVRLVIEHIVAARMHGAICLNYCEASAIESRPTFVDVTVTDTRSGDEGILRANALINCAGPWATSLMNFSAPSLKYSQGSHVLLDVPWKGEALFLPLEGKGRYYFVLPHPGGTLIGTTERELTAPVSDPLPDPSEISELKERIIRDLSRSGISFESAYMTFAGIRSLPVRGMTKDVSRIHRRHLWHKVDHTLSLVGGKYTTYVATIAEGLTSALTILRREGTLNLDLTLPGDPRTIPLDIRTEWDAIPAAKRVLSKIGSSILERCADPKAIGDIGNGVSREEIEYSLDIEQAVTIKDLMFRRLQLALLPHHGLQCLPAIRSILEERGMERSMIESQIKEFIDYINVCRALVGRGSVNVSGET